MAKSKGKRKEPLFQLNDSYCSNYYIESATMPITLLGRHEPVWNMPTSSYSNITLDLCDGMRTYKFTLSSGFCKGDIEKMVRTFQNGNAVKIDIKEI